MTSPFASLIDHTLLRPDATAEQILEEATYAAQAGCAAMCTSSLWVSQVAEQLAGSGVVACSVVGFPHGASAAGAVAREAQDAVAAGAAEIDMVLPRGLLLGGPDVDVLAYIRTVRAGAKGALLKVILESAALDADMLRRACLLAVDGGADYVKTSTGFDAAGGATLEAVRLMAATVPQSVGVKASGGIRTRAQAEAMVDAGATRLGLSGTRGILQG